jgi:hypothetical protein
LSPTNASHLDFLTTDVNTAITGSLIPYAKTTDVNTAITDSLVPYSTTTLMNTAIATATADMLYCGFYFK